MMRIYKYIHFGYIHYTHTTKDCRFIIVLHRTNQNRVCTTNSSGKDNYINSEYFLNPNRNFQRLLVTSSIHYKLKM